jgi:hypothetical protein
MLLAQENCQSESTQAKGIDDSPRGGAPLYVHGSGTGAAGAVGSESGKFKLGDIKNLELKKLGGLPACGDLQCFHKIKPVITMLHL